MSDTLEFQITDIISDDITNIAVTKCCNTKFCLECITKWLHTNKNCPFCRADITIDKMCIDPAKYGIEK